MTVEERKEKEQELYGLMELDVMRNSKKIRDALGEELNSRVDISNGTQIVNLVFPKIMTYQNITEEMLEQLINSQDENTQIDSSKLQEGIKLVKEYQRGELDISKTTRKDSNTNDNEK